MDAYNIRSSHDIKGDGRRTATAILNGRPPSSKDIAASPGLACLIVVLRRVYAFLLHHPGAFSFLDWVKSSENGNPILRVAWNSFGDEPDEVEQATISMNNLAEALSSMGFSPNESFYTLCESSLMKNTFWSHPGIPQSGPAQIRRMEDYLNSLMPEAPEAELATTDTELTGDSQHPGPEYKDRRICLNGLYVSKAAWNVNENSPGYGSDRRFREDH